MSRGKRYVVTYELTQHYGGPEEGGWWYWVITPCSWEKYSSNRSARFIKEKLEFEWRDYNKNRSNSNQGHAFSFNVESKKELGKLDTSNKPRPRYE